MRPRIVIAPDKFKGSLTARAVAEAIADGMRRVLRDAEFVMVPVADGGDGTAETITTSLGGRMVKKSVTGPNGQPVQASYGMVDDQRLAVVELAQASGLALVPEGKNDPLTATTRGTGELISAAIEAGAQRIILGIGGSATNDAGTGALSALGAVFKDKRGNELAPGGAALSELDTIDISGLEERLRNATIEIASDVKNPLCGPNGASAVYGPQKGASPADVRKLDAALGRFADVAARLTGADVRDVPGAGAAGGMGGGFVALAHATLRPGAQLVLELLHFENCLRGAKLVVTGEGRLDRQTFEGKAPMAVAQAAKAHRVPVVAIAGSIEVSGSELADAGFNLALSDVPGPIGLDEAIRRASEFLSDTGERLARALALSGLGA